MTEQRAPVRHADYGGAVIINATVDPQIKDALRQAAARENVSVSWYLNTLVARAIEEHDGLPVLGMTGGKTKRAA